MPTLPNISIQRRLIRPGFSLEVAHAAPPNPQRTAILLHGFPDLWQTWRHQLPALLAAGYQVLAPNQRGYAHSDRPPNLHDYDIDLLADDVLALANTFNVQQFSLIGHDWGGIIAWWTAARFPDRLHNLAIFNAPHPGIFRRYLLRHPGQLFRSTYVGFFQLPGLPERLLAARHGRLLQSLVQRSARPDAFSPDEWPLYRNAWLQPGALTAMINYYRALLRRPEHTLRRRIQCPVRLLWGRRDLFEQPGLATASLALCDKGAVNWWPTATHWLHREEPAAVNATLLRFLTSTR